MYSLALSVLITDQVSSLPQTFNDEFVALGSAIDILDIICGGLEMAGGIVALGDKNVVIDSAFQRLIKRNRGALQ
jgi:hypothetical protein